MKVRKHKSESLSLKTPLLLLGFVALISLFTARFIPHEVMEDAFHFSKAEGLKNHKDLKILSFASDPNHRILKLLIQSSPYPIEVLGIHQPWRCHRDKLEAVKKYIAKKNLRHSKTIIMFVDGYDTFFAPGNQDIIQAFKSFDKPIVLSAEIGCWPPSTPVCLNKNLYPKSPTKFRYVNSGTYIGYSSDLYKMLTEVLENNPHQRDDQYLLHEFFIKHPEKIALDYHQTIFFFAFETRLEDYDFDQKTGMIRNLITNRYPIVFHGNGGPTVKQLLLELEALPAGRPPVSLTPALDGPDPSPAKRE